MLGVQVGVGTVLGEEQRVEEEFVFRFTTIPEQRAPGTCQSFLLNFAQNMEQLLASLPQDDFLGYLEGGYAFAIFQCLLLADAFITLEHHASTFEQLSKLGMQFGAKKFYDRRPRQHIDRKIFRGLGAVQRRHVQVGKQRFQFLGRCPGCLRRHLRLRPYEVRRRLWLGCRRRDESVHVTMTNNQARDPEPCLLHESRAQVHVVTKVVHSQLKIVQRQPRRVTAQARRMGFLRRASEFEDRNAWHRYR